MVQTKVSGKSKRWLLPTLIYVTVFVGLAAWLFHITARRTLVGKTDPATGLHCTFTIGQGWQPDKRPSWLTKDQALDLFSFSPSNPTPFQMWIERYLLGRATSTLPPDSGITVYSFNTPPPSPTYIDLEDGYPVLKSFIEVPSIFRTTIEQKRMLISGHRATWTIYQTHSFSFSARGRTPQIFYSYVYLVKITDRPFWYAIVGSADEAHHTIIANEMRQVCDSFRIEVTNKK